MRLHKVTKSRIMRWAEQMDRMGQGRKLERGFDY
jgi:hypothetical protein